MEEITKPTRAELSPTLDPTDWETFSRQSHEALDMMIDHLRTISDRPVWRQAPPEVVDVFKRPLPRSGQPFDQVLETFRADILPYSTGNVHPLFMGWVHGAGTPYGMVGEMLAAGLNANCGGRNHIAIDVERQIARWAADLFTFGGDATGLFVTGSSMANFLAMLVARDAALGHSVRREGLRTGPQLVVYASAEVHGCVGQAAELSGIGSAHLRRIETGASGAMDMARLRAAIAKDRAEGARPFMIVATAGTVNTGAIDDLGQAADIAADEGLWLHVDGAFGAMTALSPRLKPLLKGIERADSIAFDFHKWAHVPYDAGFLLVKNGAAHRGTFESPAAYLQRTPRGTGSGELWPCDLGPDLSRGFRALKTWMTFQALGADRIGQAIETCCDVARHLEQRLIASPLFEPAAPVALNVACFKLRAEFPQDIHADIVMDLQERGIAVPSLTTIGGRQVIRCAIVNHRTRDHHMERFVTEAEESARAIIGKEG